LHRLRPKQPGNPAAGFRIPGAALLDLPAAFPHPHPQTVPIDWKITRGRKAARARTLILRWNKKRDILGCLFFYSQDTNKIINNINVSIDKINTYAMID
jgi:hypothetical protein